MEKTPPVAYFREFLATSQCELSFTLNLIIEDKNISFQNEHVRAVRQKGDTVCSLLQHLNKKLNNAMKKNENSTVLDDNNENDIEFSLKMINKNSKKSLQPSMLLQQILSMQKVVFQVFDQSYQVLINAPLVKELKLPTVLFADFTIQPSKFYSIYTDSIKSQFFWWKSKDKQNWTSLANSYKYHIQNDDVGHYLKLVCIPCNAQLKGPVVEDISENVVEVMGSLPICPFTERHKFTTNKLESNCFRIVTYNVLSFRYAQNEQYPYCSPKSLAIDYRKQIIAKELEGYNADIICMQEVDSIPYATYYKNIFKKLGYMSIYDKKGNKIPEGLCCFFNTKRFKKIDSHQLVYSEEIKSNKLFSYIWNIIKVDGDVRDCFLRQLTSLQVTVLKLRGTNNVVILGNTHLFYHPDAEHVRLGQANMATTYLDALRKRFYCTSSSNVSVIICGDFNCKPASSVVSYMLNGRVEEKADVCAKIKCHDLFHNFMLESACGFPKYTNYTHDFKDCLDYIFIERNKMRVNQVVPLPADEELLEYDGLPNDVYPSDHMPLIADLEIIA